jgi:hypothetical protein
MAVSVLAGRRAVQAAVWRCDSESGGVAHGCRRSLLLRLLQAGLEAAQQLQSQKDVELEFLQSSAQEAAAEEQRLTVRVQVQIDGWMDGYAHHIGQVFPPFFFLGGGVEGLEAYEYENHKHYVRLSVIV